MRKKLLLFCVLLCCSLVLALPQEYTITEEELMQLEKIYTNLTSDRQKQLLQVSSLKTQLTKALTKSETLNNQLQKEREQSKSLRQSLSEYENANEEIQTALLTQIEKQKETIDKLKAKTTKLVIAVTALAGVLIISAFMIAVMIYLKMKI